jgi:ABC-type branched-subunit amino acid transport system ATPase component/ABC-type branched-subunit amino acid transport system permease subunit
MIDADRPLSASLWPFALGLVILAAAPAVLSVYALHILCTMGVAVILALGLNLLMGFAGQVSLANAAFYGIGAYGVAILGNSHGVPFWLALPAVALATALIGLAVGLPALRVSSHYLALATLAFVWTVQVVLINWVSVTGGSPGFASSRKGLGLAMVAEDWQYYLVILGVTAIMVVLAVNLVNSKVGRAFMAIRDNENAAEIMGVNLARYKTLAFAVNAFYCAVAGGLQAGLVRFLDPYEFGLWPSIWHLLYIVVGGLGSVLGSVLGPLVLVALPETLRAFAEYRELIFAFILLLTLVYLPDGIAGAVLRAWAKTKGDAASPVQMQPHVGPLREAALQTAHTPLGPAEIALDVKGVSLSFGGLKAVQKAGLTMRGGEIRALIGPNGAGKTTFLNLLCRVYDPGEGTMHFRGRNLQACRSHDLVGLGIVRTFQNIRLFGKMTVLENVMVGMHVHLREGLLGAALRLPAATTEAEAGRRRAMALLAYVGLDSAAHAKAGSLSFGQQRRLELARALAADPALLLLDEPASGLDKSEIEELVAILKTIRDRLSVTILLIEHNMNFVMGLADTITVLDHGVVIAEGTPTEIQRNERVIEAYLGKGHAIVDA